MDDHYLYQRIAENIRQDILTGKLKAGDRLPSIRDLTIQWECTTGTIQRAYKELSDQGLVSSQAGKGTHVSGRLEPNIIQSRAPFRRVNMVHRAEAFLLESLIAGYTLEEIQQSLDMAEDRWRSLQKGHQSPSNPQIIRFSGSHDMSVIWLAGHLEEIVPGASLHLDFSGSLGGLMALAEGKVELTGTHLLDAESGLYNIPFVQKLFPGKNMMIVRLANRHLGFILPPGNPKGINQLEDLTRPDVLFVNRQSGSGTRVWLDLEIQKNKVNPLSIQGYHDERFTHSEIARTVAEGKADVGIGLQSAASAFSLMFIPLVEEAYDLVAFLSAAEQPPISTLFSWISSLQGKQNISSLDGYDFSHTGEKTVLHL